MVRFFSIVIGIIVFAIALNVGRSIVGPIVCEDGWHSSSIGRQGACSYHGGVDDTAQNFVGIFSVVSGVVSGFFFFGFVDEKRKKKELAIYEEKHKNDPLCSEHNIRMVKKNGRFGEFWGCPQYPRCKITKNIDKEV